MTEQRKNRIAEIDFMLNEIWHARIPKAADVALLGLVDFVRAVDNAFEKGTDPQFVLNAIFVARARFEEGN